MADAPAPAETTETPPSGSKTFSQADVDRIVAERLSGERETIAKLRAQLGEANSSLGDLEQLNRRVETLTRERNEARETSKQATARAEAATMRAEVTAVATRAGAVDADDVFRLLPEGAVSINDEGAIEGAEEAVSKLSESKPHLFTAAPRPGSGDGGARPESTEPTRQAPGMNDLIRRAAGRT